MNDSGINVISLFDGISCGMIALEKAGIKINNYYASEIDQNAINISKKNYSNIVQIGDVTKIKYNGKQHVDLFIGGSPCTGFSLLGKQMNFNDPQSKLFFEYVRILKEIQKINLNVKFLLENVKMKIEHSDVISKILEVNPIRINSSLITACRRDRLYWTNIPNVTIPEPIDISFDDINDNSQNWLSKEFINKVANWKAQQKPLENSTIIGTKSKLPCLTARGYNQNHSGCIFINNGEDYRYLTNLEAERAMGVPENYTKGFKDQHIAHALGNGWSVQIIKNIFKNL